MPADNQQTAAILDTAIRAVGERTGFELVPIEPKLGGCALVELKNGATQYRAQVKRYLNKQTVELLAARMAQDDAPTILVTDYVNSDQAIRLRQLDIPFMDTAGNVYINEPPVFVLATGNKPETLPTARPRVRLFQPAGLKLIFALLNQPGLEARPYREQAKIAHVALGAVAWIMNNLRKGGHLIEPTRQTRRLVNKRALLDLWVENYPQRLREKLVLGRYETTQRKWWENTDIAEHHACWGGGVAADRLTHYLKPEDTTIYADKVPARVLLDNRLEKTTAGNVEIIRRFWNFNYPEEALQVAPPLLVYADLIATGVGRNTEVAQLVYDKYVVGYIQED